MYLVVDSGRPDLGNEDVVGGAGNGDSLGSDLAQDADGNTRTVGSDVRRAPSERLYGACIPRERVAHHKVSVDAQLLAKLANLVLEQLP